MIENHSGDIPQLEVKQSHRRMGAATALLKHLLQYTESHTIKIITTLAGYEPFIEFAGSLMLNSGPGQHEMILEL